MAIDRRSQSFKTAKMLASSVSLKNGKYVPTTGALKKRAKTVNAAQNLIVRGLMPEPSNMSAITTNRMSIELMHAIGYTVETQQQNHDLILEANQAMSAYNSSVGVTYGPANGEFVQQSMSMNASFPNECDPIYQADDNIPEASHIQPGIITIEMAQTLDLVSSAAIFGNMGLSITPTGKTTKYFDNQEVSNAASKLNR